MKRNVYPLLLTATASMLLLTGCVETIKRLSPTPEINQRSTRTETAILSSSKTIRAIYLGVEKYGAPQTTKDHLDEFHYRFEVDGTEKVYSVDNGNHCEIQNRLKENHRFEITLSNDTVVAVREIPDPSITAYVPPVSGTPGKKTLLNFLKTAMAPVGTALYIYGGGWNWQDESSGIQTRTLGISKDWVEFFRKQTADYTYKNESDPAHSYYPFGAYNEYYYAGLDCSGYLGWVLYNTFETKSGNAGYVSASTGFAKSLSEKGWGKWTNDIAIPGRNATASVRPGDIISINGHVWISLGTCNDGSVLILHSSPTESRTGQPGGGVQLSAIGTDKACKACILASCCMSHYFPKWFRRYDIALKKPKDYFTFESESAGLFSWNTSAANGLADPDGLQQMKPEKVLLYIFLNK